MSRRWEEAQAAARVRGAAKPHRPGPQGPTRQREPRQSWSHTRWSEQKRRECEQEPRGQCDQDPGDSSTRGRQNPPRRTGGAVGMGWGGVGWLDSLSAKVVRRQEPGAAGSTTQQEPDTYKHLPFPPQGPREARGPRAAPHFPEQQRH